MVRRTLEETPADKGARVFFGRRRQGVDSKVRSMILGLANKHNVDINVTVIYEYKNEVSMFRSQPGDTGRWFSTVRDLRAVSSNCTGMGHVDPMTRELLEWQLRHEHNQTAATPQGPSTPQRETRSRKERSANTRNQPQMEDRGGVSEDAAVEDETDEDDRTDGDYPDESEDESDDDDWQLMGKHEDDMDSKKELSCVPSVEVPRQSPKRKRSMMAESSQGNVPSFPSPTPASMYPVYNQYAGGGPHMQLGGSPSALGNFITHPSMPPMEQITAHQNGMTPENCFYPDMGIGNFDIGANFSSERGPQAMPVRSLTRAALPQPPLPRKGRGSKNSKRGAGVRKTKTS